MNPKRHLLDKSPQVINLGLEVFADTLTGHGVPVAQVDWRPPAGGDARLADMLRQLRERGRRPNST